MRLGLIWLLCATALGALAIHHGCAASARASRGNVASGCPLFSHRVSAFRASPVVHCVHPPRALVLVVPMVLHGSSCLVHATRARAIGALPKRTGTAVSSDATRTGFVADQS